MSSHFTIKATMSKKKAVLAEIFAQCKNKGDFVFHNDFVKAVSAEMAFGNPFDVTKLDSSAMLPEIMMQHDYFIIHLGQGWHQFVKGIDNGFHAFEAIAESDIKEWDYKKSLLNEFDTSESNILSLGFNQRIIHDFLYEDIADNPKVYFSRHIKTPLEYSIAEQPVKAKNVQVKIDLTMELNGVVTIFEGKNNFPENFTVYQLFSPYLYYQKLKKENQLAIKEINCCYLLRKKQDTGSVIRIYQYSFTKENDLTSIKLLKAKQYHLMS